MLGKRALRDLSCRANDAAGGGYSSFAQKMMKNMGWEEGTGLGKDRQGMASYVKVKKKEDDAGIGREKAVRAAATEQWYFGAFEDAIAAVKHLDSSSKKSKKKKDKKDKSKKERKVIDEETIYQEMFEKSGGARMGMRARASQLGKLKRTMDHTETCVDSITPVSVETTETCNVESVVVVSTSNELIVSSEACEEESREVKRIKRKKDRQEARSSSLEKESKSEKRARKEESRKTKKSKKSKV